MPQGTGRAETADRWREHESAGVLAARLVREVLADRPPLADREQVGEWLRWADRELESLLALSRSWWAVWCEVRTEVVDRSAVVDLRSAEPVD